MSSIPSDEPVAAAAAAAAAHVAAQQFLQLEDERKMRQLLAQRSEDSPLQDANAGAEQMATDEDDGVLRRLTMQASDEQGYQSASQNRMHAVATSAVAAALHASSNRVEHDTIMALTRDVIEEYGVASEAMGEPERDVGQQHGHRLQNHMQTPMGKPRTKVSRACDACRRKKIKCDATADNESATCTSCHKNNIICEFQRTPQKRGPSRGYIKDLSERVQLLEGRIQPGSLAPDSLSGAGFVEAMESYTPSRHSVLAGMKRGRSFESDDYHSNRGGFQPANLPPPPQLEAESSIISDENFLSLYYSSIHQVFPILPLDPAMGDNYVNRMPVTSRLAFEKVLRLVHASKLDTAAFVDASETVIEAIETDQAQLPHVQMLMLLDLEKSNMLGFNDVLRNPHTNSRDHLSNAIYLAHSLGLFPLSLSDIDSSPLSDWLDETETGSFPHEEIYSMFRRTACSLFIFQTFCNFSSHKLHSLKHPTARMMIFREKTVLGIRLYRLAKLTQLLHTIMETTILPPHGDKPSMEDYLLAKQQRAILAEDSEQLNEIQDRLHDVLHLYNEDLDAVHEDPVQSLTFWFVALALETWIWPVARGRTMMLFARHLVKGLAGLVHTRNPLRLHFSGAAAHILTQLAQFQEYQAEALESLADLEALLTEANTASEVNWTILSYIRLMLPVKNIAQAETTTGFGTKSKAGTAASNDNAHSGQSIDEIIKAAASAAAHVQAAYAKAGVVSAPQPPKSNFKPLELSRDGYFLAISREVVTE